MRIVTLSLLSFGLVALASPPGTAVQIPVYPDEAVAQSPPGQPVPPAPVEDEEPIWLGDTPQPPTQAPGKAAPKKGAGPQEKVIYHWVDADGIDSYSDEVPAAYQGKADIVRGELMILRWSN